MQLVFHQVPTWVENFLKQMRAKGLAGNIIQDSVNQLEGSEVATWTGADHQLAFIGEPESFRLELRRFERGTRIPFWVERDPNKFHAVLMDFCTKEG